MACGTSKRGRIFANKYSVVIQATNRWEAPFVSPPFALLPSTDAAIRKNISVTQMHSLMSQLELTRIGHTSKGCFFKTKDIFD